ncbi:MAG TPA: EAL domain-containing protein [Bacillota bacterium]|nr:EAL domain-containing protein [Bacillota bacterium]
MNNSNPWNMEDSPLSKEEWINTIQELTDIKYAFDQSVTIAVTDTNGIITYANEQFCRISHYTKEELVGQNLRIVNSGFHPQEFFEEMWKTIRSGKVWKGEIRNRAKDGSLYWVRTTIVPFLTDELKPYQYVSIRLDITDLKLMEEEIRKREEKYRLITENATDLIAVISPDGRFTYVSPSNECVLGWKREQLTNGSLIDWVHPEDREIVLEGLKIIAYTRAMYQMEIRMISDQGKVMVLEVRCNPVLNEEGYVKEIILVSRDVTDRKKMDETIYYLAFHDPLTNLPNRRLFKDRLIQELRDAAELQSSFSIMFLDIDYFKSINDTLGHDKGDMVLKQVAARLSLCIRKGDMVSRNGGDEFTILLEKSVQRDEAKSIAERVLQSFKQPFDILGKKFLISPSIGVALYPHDGKTADDLLKHADIALYYVKKHGKANYAFYSPTMDVRSLEQISLENELRLAIEKEQFILHYQPKINMKTGQIIGIESLVRWNHPQLGLIPPSDFIPLTEETGLILPIGEWILRTACIQNKKWQEQGLIFIPISVNLSALQFQHEHFVDEIQCILNETGLEPQWLEFELTESVLIDQSSDTLVKLQRLKQMGIKLSLDDFGTGYSSLSYLKKFPVDTIKIDSSFIRDLNQDKYDLALVTAIISMADALGLNVIAEGIETEQQLSILIQKGCKEGQGFLFSRPLQVEHIETYFNNFKFCMPKSKTILEADEISINSEGQIKNNENE